MPSILLRIRNIISSRLVRNIVFWICTFLLVYVANNGGTKYDRSIYNIYKVATTCILIVMTVVNNFVLIPTLLARKKKAWYIISTTVWILLTSLTYMLILKDMMQRYPGIDVYEVGLITSPLSADWSVGTILNELVTFAVGFAGWLVIFTMAWYMNAYAKQEKIAREAAHKQTEAELSLLRNQVNPHFLFNTLNNIYGLSLQKSDDTPESILKLSSIMRYMLYDADVSLMPFEKEKEIMQAYIDMELLRLQQNDRFKFTISADRNYMIPPLLWLPILENIFKHGTRVISDNYFIDYSFTITDDSMHISATNNYKETSKQPGGIGLDNLKKRLDILYPGQYKLVTEKTGEQYHTELTVTLS